MPYQTQQELYDLAVAEAQKLPGYARVQGGDYTLEEARRGDVRQYRDAIKNAQRQYTTNYAPQIDMLGQQINQAEELYNPYIKQGQEALQRYQSLLGQPVQLSQAQQTAQYGDMGNTMLNNQNQLMQGNQQIDANAAVQGGLFGGNRLRAQGMLGTGMAQQQQGQFNELQQGYYQQALGDRQAELGNLGNTVNLGQRAASGLGDVTTQAYSGMANLYQQYGNQRAQRLLADKQAKQGALSSALGLAGTIVGGYYGNAAGAAAGGQAGSMLGNKLA